MGNPVGDAIVGYARAHLGDPYVFGAEGPNSFDCSGLVYAAYKAAGLNVTRTTAANLGKQGTGIPLSAAQPGDVVYYDEPGAIDHVGIYIGNNQMIDAPTEGKPVEVVGIGNPTSIRRLSNSVAKGGPITSVTDETGGLLDSLNPFSGWQSDTVSIGLKIVAAGACVALAVVGLRETVKDKD